MIRVVCERWLRVLAQAEARAGRTLSGPERDRLQAVWLRHERPATPRMRRSTFLRLWDYAPVAVRAEAVASLGAAPRGEVELDGDAYWDWAGPSIRQHVGRQLRRARDAGRILPVVS